MCGKAVIDCPQNLSRNLSRAVAGLHHRGGANFLTRNLTCSGVAIPRASLSLDEMNALPTPTASAA